MSGGVTIRDNSFGNMPRKKKEGAGQYALATPPHIYARRAGASRTNGLQGKALGKAVVQRQRRQRGTGFVVGRTVGCCVP